MRKIVYISLLYLACLALAISCSKKTIQQDIPRVKVNNKIEKITGAACLEQLVAALGYTQERFTENVMECNILKVESLDASIRNFKGHRRLEIVYLNAKCDDISRMLSQYELECKKSLTVTEL